MANATNAYGLSRVLKVIQDNTTADITLSAVITFLEVAKGEGRHLTELANSLGLAPSTASRQLLDLGLRNRQKEPGLGLVAAKQDLQDLRLSRYELTPKGRRLMTLVVRNGSDAGESGNGFTPT